VNADPPSEVDDGRLLLAHTLDTLHEARHGTHSYEGWFHVDQILRAMDGAELRLDLDSLRQLVKDLELTAPEPSGGRTAPPNVVELITSLITRVDRRIRKLSRPTT
jgi:hypothetical protein